MANLNLSLAVTTNDRTSPIIDGSVRAQGVDLTVTAIANAGEIFWRQLHFKEFDASEMSVSEMIMLVSRGDNHWIMLPVFTTRRFFHTRLLVRTDAGIDEPADLGGKRIGVSEYIQTAALWTRGALQHEFSVAPEQMEWYQERIPPLSHGSVFDFEPAGVPFRHMDPTKSIGSMLVAGELDATVTYSSTPGLLSRSTLDLRGRPEISALFADPVEEGARYYRKTGIFPMNHGVVVRRSIAEKHPWVALNLFQAFVDAKERAAARTRELLDIHADLGQLTPELRSALDTDPLPYGIKANRDALETCARYSYEQGLSPRPVDLEEVFATPTLDL